MFVSYLISSNQTKKLLGTSIKYNRWDRAEHSRTTPPPTTPKTTQLFAWMIMLIHLLRNTQLGIYSPPYSPDIDPCDFHLFRSVTHVLSDRNLTSNEVNKNWIESWVASKDEVYPNASWKLTKVVVSNWQYFEYRLFIINTTFFLKKNRTQEILAYLLCLSNTLCQF